MSIHKKAHPGQTWMGYYETVLSYCYKFRFFISSTAWLAARAVKAM